MSVKVAPDGGQCFGYTVDENGQAQCLWGVPSVNAARRANTKYLRFKCMCVKRALSMSVLDYR